MLKILLLSVSTFLLGGCFSDTQDTDNSVEQPPTIAFVNARLLPMTDEPNEVTEPQTVLIEGDRIVAIGTDVELPANVTILDVAGEYLLPGLGEMHGHVPPEDSFEGIPDRYLDDVLYLYLAGGVTTVRGMLGYPHQLDLKADVREGERAGPTLYLAGPSFSGNSIESTEQAVRRVIEQAEAGWDLLKIHPGLSWQEYRSLTEEARARGIDFAGHVPSEVGLDRALENGQRTIDHLDGYIEYLDAATRPISRAQLQRGVAITLEHDAGVVPTQALWETLIGAADADQLRDYEELKWMPKQVRDTWLNFLDEPGNPYFNNDSASIQASNRQGILRALYEAGVPIYFGTDAPQLFSVPGISVKHELAKMAAAGIDQGGILASATRNVGDYFADKDQFGRIDEGYRADLLWVQENPLEDLQTIAKHKGVMVRGEWLSRTAIDAKLAEIEQAYAE